MPAYSPSLGLYLTGGEHSDSWQDNWVFKQTTSVLTASMRNTVAMLGPNATDDVKAQIGNKDFDLVSELSELDEVASSDSDVSMNCFYKDLNKDAAEPENDNEYTIYEMVPVRKYSDNLNLLQLEDSGLGTGSDSLVTARILSTNICQEKRRNGGYLWLGEEIGESSTDDIAMEDMIE